MRELCKTVTEEKVLKELDNIYGIEKCKKQILDYINYVKLRAAKKVEYGNFNISIQYKGSTKNAYQLIDFFCDVLMEEKIITSKYAVLEDDDINDNVENNRRRNKDNNEMIKSTVKNEMLVIDCDNTFISERKINRLIEKYDDRIFIIVEECDRYGCLQSYKNVTWKMDIQDISEDESKKYIKSVLKENGISIDRCCNLQKIVFRNGDSEQDINGLLLKIILCCKENNIGKITNRVIIEDFDFLEENQKAMAQKSSKRGRAELEEMVGVESVKEQVDRIVNFVKVNKHRGNMPALHMCFKGNPGTGKTSVARIIGKIFAEQKILSDKDIFVEVHGRDLVAKFVGWTASKTKSLVEKAEGGILFIDEAYSLNSDRRGSFEDEAIDTLIKEMEDKRDRVCIILAGYEKEMDDLMERNPGFQSRIPFHINFPDYSEEELYQIFGSMCKKHNYQIAPNCKKILTEYFRAEKSCKDFSNGRCARNILEKIEMEQANRVVNDKGADVNLITKADVEKGTARVKKVVSDKLPIGFRKDKSY